MSTPQRGVDRMVAATLVTIVLAAVPAACKQAEAVEVEHYQASKITPGQDGEHPTVTITKLAAEQIGLQTAAVEKTKNGTTIPYESVLYDAAGGQAYVFSNPEGLTFHREDVNVEKVDGDTVHLSKGPAVGTRVVTVGLPQIHGAELEFGAY
jgi:hypothetical protein